MEANINTNFTWIQYEEQTKETKVLYYELSWHLSHVKCKRSEGHEEMSSAVLRG